MWTAGVLPYVYGGNILDSLPKGIKLIESAHSAPLRPSSYSSEKEKLLEEN